MIKDSDVEGLAANAVRRMLAWRSWIMRGLFVQMYIWQSTWRRSGTESQSLIDPQMLRIIALSCV